MTREEAIERLEDMYNVYYNQLSDEDKEAIEMAIAVLKAQHCEDAVSREAVLSRYADWHGYGYDRSYIYQFIKNLPPVTPEPRTGKWIKTREWVTPTNNVNDDYQVDVYTCSHCKSEFGLTFRFCPNCGEKKEGESEVSE